MSKQKQMGTNFETWCVNDLNSTVYGSGIERYYADAFNREGRKIDIRTPHHSIQCKRHQRTFESLNTLFDIVPFDGTTAVLLSRTSVNDKRYPPWVAMFLEDITSIPYNIYIVERGNKKWKPIKSVFGIPESTQTKLNITAHIKDDEDSDKVVAVMTYEGFKWLIRDLMSADGKQV